MLSNAIVPVNPPEVMANPAGVVSMTPTNVAALQTVSSMDQLKALDPKVYEATLKSIANTIVKSMQHSQERIKEMMRESRSR